MGGNTEHRPLSELSPMAQRRNSPNPSQLPKVGYLNRTPGNWFGVC